MHRLAGCRSRSVTVFGAEACLRNHSNHPIQLFEMVTISGRQIWAIDCEMRPAYNSYSDLATSSPGRFTFRTIRGRIHTFDASVLSEFGAYAGSICDHIKGRCWRPKDRAVQLTGGIRDG